MVQDLGELKLFSDSSLLSKFETYYLNELPYYLKKLMPTLDPTAHKGQNGKIAVIGGS